MKTASASACLMICLVLSGCQVGESEEIGSTQPYSEVVGSQYRVASEDLRGYGIYGDWPENKTTVTRVELNPGVGIDGPEVAFRRTIPKGAVVKILSAWREAAVFETRVYYLVELANSELPQGVPVRLALAYGNEGVGAELNPTVYARISSATK